MPGERSFSASGRTVDHCYIQQMSETGTSTRVSALQKGLWWLQDYLYAGIWQVRGVLSRVQPGSFHSGHRSPVIIIPGVYENWQFMLPLIQAIHDAGHPVHVVTVLQRNKLKVPVAARLVAEHLEESGLQNAVIVAHSKGGLIGKCAMLLPDPEHRIDRMITVCTPFSGSRYANYMLLPTLRIFSPRNALTLELAREERINSRVTSIYGPFDPHIPEGSVLPGATNIELPTAGHFRILGDAETARVIVEQLNPSAR
jgi:pimeloyl-ACP methyl ester carboxylesterase